MKKSKVKDKTLFYGTKQSNGYYNLDRLDKTILDKDPAYRIAFGARGPGKTTAVLKRILETYVNEGREGVLIRRYGEDFKQGRSSKMWTNLTNLDGINYIKQVTNGEWDDIKYYRNSWFLCREDEELGCVKDIKPFCYAIALNASNQTKSVAFPNVKIIFFDEFVEPSDSNRKYLPEEFKSFLNLMSTIVRMKEDCIVYMMGNNVDKNCPYFREFGIDVKKFPKGGLSSFQYGDSGTIAIVEYTNNYIEKLEKANDRYFGFNSGQLATIKNTGWDLKQYPLYYGKKINKKDIIFKSFIIFNKQAIQIDTVSKDKEIFNMIHGNFVEECTEVIDGRYVNYKNVHKIDEIDEDNDLIFSDIPTTKYNYVQNINKSRMKPALIVLDLIMKGKCFFDSNETGAVMEGYLDWCRRH